MSKKLLIVFAALLLASLLLIFVTPLGLPAQNDFDTARQFGTTVCAAENRATESYVFEINKGKATNVRKWSNLKDGRTNPVVAVTQSEGRIFAVCEYETEWKIRAADKSGGAPSAVLAHKKGDSVLDLTIDQGTFSLVVRNADGSVKVLESDKANPNHWKTKLMIKAPEAGDILEARYINPELLLKYSDGQQVSLTNTGVAALEDETAFAKPLTEKLRFSFSVRLASKLTIMLFTVLCLALLFAPIIIAFSIIKKTKQFKTRMSTAFIALFFVAGCVFCGIVCLDTVLTFSASALPMLLLKMLIALVLFSVIGALTVRKLMGSSTEPIEDLARRMSKISDGDYSVHDIPQREDELGEMYRNLQQMCLSLSIRDYEVNSIMQAYHRFVPRGLENLLDRASIMEVSLGDSRAINGNVGLITVCNRQSVRQEFKDDDYSDFVSRSSVLMSSAVRVHEGLLLSSGFDMSASKFYFGKERSDGVKAGLDL
ncbi:MAG: HAMP domain-containing protein, partial [Oscillospiraceae bacterium]